LNNHGAQLLSHHRIHRLMMIHQGIHAAKQLLVGQRGAVELRLERTKTESNWSFTGPLRVFRQKNRSMFTKSKSSGEFMPSYIANKIIHVVRSLLP
jgi:hypothetical protein